MSGTPISSQISKIERGTVITAPRSRVWKALTEIAQFGKWFSTEPVHASAQFQPGVTVRLISTYPGPCQGVEFDMEIVDMVPETLFSWRWHPGMPVPGEDLSTEPMTLVEFRLEDAAGGTRVTVIETGFDKLFEHRRARVLEENEGGWKHQVGALEQYFRDAR